MHMLSFTHKGTLASAVLQGECRVNFTPLPGPLSTVTQENVS